MTLVLSQESHEALVVFRRHHERRRQQLVVASCLLETESNDLSEIAPRQVARQEWFVDDRPETLAALHHSIEQGLRHGGDRRSDTRLRNDGRRPAAWKNFRRQALDT